MPTKHGDGAQRVSREVSLECIYVCLQLITEHGCYVFLGSRSAEKGDAAADKDKKQ